MGGYEYTLLKQDGTTENLGVYPQKATHDQLYKMLGCFTVQIIPETYYEGHGRCTMWADEDGRFIDTNRRNPHFKVLQDPSGYEFDVVGNVLKEKKL